AQAKFYAYELDRFTVLGDLRQLAQTITSAKLDLNPHQIEAALFVLSSPYRRSAILADEVGLGKTIEAGLVLSQLWAQGERKQLVILPPNLIGQWQTELMDKFSLSSFVLDGYIYTKLRKQGVENPFFRQDEVVLCTYDFAYDKAEIIEATGFDMAVFDEAHRLLSVYKQETVISRALRSALAGTDKLLLTATPFMNTLMELYGISTFVTDEMFGDAAAFESQYVQNRADRDEKLIELGERAHKFTVRTLRRQVRQTIRYTNRHCITQEFTLLPQEKELYDRISAYLRKPKLYAIRQSGRPLVERGLWKRLASSSFAVAGTLDKFISRLKALKIELEKALKSKSAATIRRVKYTAADTAGIIAEIEELESCSQLAKSITENAKGAALLLALQTGFQHAATLGAERKVILYTESLKTQAYLFSLLENNGYAGRVVTINGSNSDPRSEQIHRDWEKHNRTPGGSAKANRRTAILDYFKSSAQILIALESASDGLNLQVSSFVCNYDLPWNPQRIEQRIGRCHRYGQKFDVVVLNFLNRDNIADRRVYELLSEKFHLFEGVFGASDTVLGAVDSIDFERRVADIYTRCRTAREIEAAFDALQEELEAQISDRMADAREKLLAHFDGEVAEKFDLTGFEVIRHTEAIRRMLWELTKYRLGGDFAEFDDNSHTFRPRRKTVLGYRANELHYGLYEQEPRRLYHPNHTLARRIFFDIQMNMPVYPEGHRFLLPAPPPPVLEGLAGKRGIIAMYAVNAEKHYKSVERGVLLAGRTSGGETLTQEQARRVLSLEADGGYLRPESKDFRDTAEWRSVMNTKSPEEYFSPEELAAERELLEQAGREYEADLAERFEAHVRDERARIALHGRDKKLSLELPVKKLEKRIGDAKAKLKKPKNLAARLKLEQDIGDLEQTLASARMKYYEDCEAVDADCREKERTLLEKLDYEVKYERVFMINWRVNS
ncbi:DEAD/DEAH box helicase, partial [Oscillospiraceae bacterium OttesenSCG-928-F05]|nr:DEAD/DEAH box helicase [Oscillospiraceae bacterium OttesenSCG-928-F05]